MTAKPLLPGQKIVEADGRPTREFVELIQRIVGGVNGFSVDGLLVANFAGAAVEDSSEGLTATNTALPTSGAVLAAITAAAVGIGQTWQDVTGSRAASTSYQNATGGPIMVAIVAVSTAWMGRLVQVSPDGSAWLDVGFCAGSGGGRSPNQFIVPNGWYYRIDGAVNNLSWAELR